MRTQEQEEKFQHIISTLKDWRTQARQVIETEDAIGTVSAVQLGAAAEGLMIGMSMLIGMKYAGIVTDDDIIIAMKGGLREV